MIPSSSYLCIIYLFYFQPFYKGSSDAFIPLEPKVDREKLSTLLSFYALYIYFYFQPFYKGSGDALIPLEPKVDREYDPLWPNEYEKVVLGKTSFIYISVST